MRAILFLVLLAWPVLLRAQSPNPRLDSLETALRSQSRPDTNRLKTLNELVWEHRSSNPARSLALADEALRLGRQHGFLKGQAKTHALLGIVHSYAGRYDEGRAAFTRALVLRRQLGDSVGVAGMINNVGSTHQEQGHYEAAVRAFVQALAMEEKYGTPERLAYDLANLGSVMALMGRHEQALRYLRHYLRVQGRSLYPPNESEIRRNLASVFLQLSQPDSTRYYAQAAYELSHGSGDQGGEGAALRILAQASLATKELVKAEAYARRALALAQKLAAQPEALQAWLVLGQLEQQRGAPAQARASLRQAWQLARETADLKSQHRTAQALARVEKQLGNFPEALRFQERAGQLQDSLLAEQTTRQVADLQTKYDTEQKEARNRLQAAQLRLQQQVIRRQRQQLLGGLVIAALLAGLAYLLYNRHRLRQAMAHEQERQQQERQRATAILNAEEAERRRIGSDLHDGVGQLLSVVKININALNEELAQQLDADQVRRFGDALDLVDESVREVRSISHNLLPNALIKRGLARAVREFLEKVQQAGRLRIRLETLGLDGARLDPVVENALYRVIQELVQNIVKHAQASEMDLQLIRHEHELTLLVEDNGHGFDPAALGPDAGIGLRNIASRVAYLGGTLDIDGRPGRGTTITATIPLQSEKISA